MLCPVCQVDNRSARRFCHACAVPLVAMTCPGCGFENEPGERYCGGCAREAGARGEPKGVASPLAAPMGASTQPVVGGAERRQITVMFCDMVGSTALSNELDAEVLRDVIARFQDACAAAVARHDGFIARYMGDGMLVYFGYPRAHEDSAERAVRAGLDIVRAVADIDAAPVKPEVRVGIATGRVVVGDLIGEGVSEERAVVGETPNLAARLQSLAEPGTVVVAPRTRRMVEHAFDLEDLGEHPLKGFKDPVRAWRALGAAAHARRPARAIQVPLHGRDLELALLRDRWAAATRGEGGAVSVVGAMGSGKTHLIDAFVDEVLEEGVAVDVVRCACLRHQGSTTLAPFADQVAVAAGIRLDDGSAVRRDKLREWAERWSRDPDAEVVAIAPLLGVEGDDDDEDSPQARRAEMLTALSRYVSSVSDGRRRVLLVVEDAQWADPTTLELLERVLREAGDGASLVVVSHRPDFDAPWRDVPGLTGVTLGRVREQAARQLVAAVTGPTPLPTDVVDRIVQRADGVPGFIVELASAMSKRDGERGAALLVPESLHDSFAAQLDALGSVRVLAQTASVLGRSFSRDLLERVVETPSQQLEEQLAQLTGEGVLQAPTGPGAPYVFRQALLADVAHDSLLASELKRLHDRVASVLLEELPAVAEADPAAVARHLSGAGRDGDAADWWQKAAAAALAQASFLEAVSLQRRAVACLESDLDREDEGAVRHLVEQQLELANRLRLIRGVAEADELVDRAEELLSPFDLPATLAHVYFVRGNLAFNRSASAECTAAHTRGLELAERSGDAYAIARALGGVFDAKQAEGERVTAVEMGLRCVAEAMANGFEEIAAANAAATAFSCIATLRNDDGYRMAVLADELARKTKNPRARMIALNGRAILAADRFALDEAEQAIGTRNGELSSDARQAAGFAFIDHRVVRMRNGWRDAHRVVVEGLKHVESSAMSLGGSARWNDVIRAKLLAECDQADVDPLLEHCFQVIEDGAANLSFWVMIAIIEGLMHRGDWERLSLALDRLSPKVHPEREPRMDLWYRAGRAAVAYGRRAEADDETRAGVQALIDEASSTRTGAVVASLREVLGDAPAAASTSASVGGAA